MEYVIAITTIDALPKARELATTLVREHLVAGVNILAIAESIYEWKGQRHHTPEWLLLMTTTQARVAALKARLPTLHPYECPQLIITPITDGHPPFLAWIEGTLPYTITC